MSQEHVEQFLGRLITDDGFRDEVAASFSRAILENGFSLTHEEMRILQKLKIDRFASLAKSVDKGIRRSRGSGNFSRITFEPERGFS